VIDFLIGLVVQGCLQRCLFVCSVSSTIIEVVMVVLVLHLSKIICCSPVDILMLACGMPLHRGQTLNQVRHYSMPCAWRLGGQRACSRPLIATEIVESCATCSLALRPDLSTKSDFFLCLVHGDLVAKYARAHAKLLYISCSP
jgi:hypothetical protein